MLDARYSPKLLLGLEDLWRNEIFVDTTLEFGDEEVKVHRAVLAAASDYFKSMFAGALKESWSHEKIRINEVDGKSFNTLIEYSYTGNVDVNQKNVLILLKTADLLQFDSVRHLCSEFLVAELSPSNCLDMSNLAQSIGMWELLERSRLYLLENVGQVAKCIPTFFKLGLDEFEVLLNSENLLVPKEETVLELILSWIKYDTEERMAHLNRLIHLVKLPFVRRFYLMQLSSIPLMAGDVCANYISEARDFQAKKINRSDFAYDHRFKPRPSTGIYEIYVRIGGTNADLDELSVVEGYNPITKNWRRLSEPLGEPLRGGYSVCALGTDLYISGGRSSDGLVTNRCYRFQPQIDSWSLINGMIQDREYHCSASLCGKLYCVSGDSGAEVFDPESSAWKAIKALPTKCENLQAIGSKGKLFVVASPINSDGENGNISLFVYDPQEDDWSSIELEPPEPWSVCPLMTSLNGILYFLGDDSKILQCYDPVSKSWSLLANSTQVHLGGSVTALDGKITISGGYASESGLTDLIEQYDTQTDSWSEYARLKEPTFWHGSVSVFRLIKAPMSPDYQSSFLQRS